MNCPACEEGKIYRSNVSTLRCRGCNFVTNDRELVLKFHNEVRKKVLERRYGETTPE